MVKRYQSDAQLLDVEGEVQPYRKLGKHENIVRFE
jgi:hypothetical protein